MLENNESIMNHSNSDAVIGLSNVIYDEILIPLHKHLTYKKYVAYLTVSQHPKDWDAQPRDERGKEEILHLVSLARESQEFKTVQEKFLKSLRGKVSITMIERIQNPSMFFSYMSRKQSMDDKNGTLENEMQLFHGTKYDSVKAINIQGFNRSLCGQHGKYCHIAQRFNAWRVGSFLERYSLKYD